MIETILKDLIKKDETNWLEFKSYWYWGEDEKNLTKGWGEFLKDFSALFNTYSKDSDKKYFIIGFDEKTKKCQNFDIDNKKRKISLFNKESQVKPKIIQKLKTHFKNIPIYRNSYELNGIEDLFEIHTLTIKKNRLLMFEFFPAPYLLELKKFLQGNESFKEGNIIFRKYKTDGSPENTNANLEEIVKLKDIVERNQINNFPKRDISIAKIVEVFKDKICPSSEIKKIQSKKNSTSGIYFEIYTISGEYTAPIDFIYYSKYTSQTLTMKYIKKNKYIKNDSKKIVLADQFNKKGGRIDKIKIENEFKKNWDDVEVFYLEEFALNKLYNNLFDTEIFHQGNFNIKYFIEPFTDQSDGITADTILNDWFINKEKPLLVIKGAGGIGKTTILKYFLDNLFHELKGENDINILFISSHEIINDIMRCSNVEDIFDFYNAVAERNNIAKRFDKKLLELSIDNGNLIIAIDGLDEVISKMGAKFNVISFINAIYENYSHNLEKAKIIITCRDYFWDKNSIDHEISSITLHAFNKELATKYFSFFFKMNKLNKAMSLANKFAVYKDEKKIYIPYILDMISENLLDDISSDSINSKILQPDIDKNDYLVGKVCEREIIKLDNLSIDNQIIVFITIATRYNGVLHYDQFNIFKDILGMNFNNNTIEKFKGHPLLIHDNESSTIKFRYDFFEDYFKCICLSNFLNDTDFQKIDEYIIKIINEHISYGNSFTKNIRKRLAGINNDDLKFAILEFMQSSMHELSYLSYENKKHLNSSLFVLLLAINPNNTINESTSLLKEMYETSSNTIENLHIINLHSKTLFDFRGLKFHNCHFENFEYFAECKYDDNTYFSSTTFIKPLFRNTTNSQLTKNNIDFVSCIDSAGILDLVNEQDRIFQVKDSILRNDTKRIIRFFWSNGAFKQKLVSNTRKKLTTVSNLLDILINERVILTENVPTKHKRVKTNDKVYFINPDYSNLRKILEENDTCFEFEKIIKKLSTNGN